MSLALDEALRQFEIEDPDKAQLVKLHILLGSPCRTRRRHWESRSQLPNAIGSTPGRGCTAGFGTNERFQNNPSFL